MSNSPTRITHPSMRRPADLDARLPLQNRALPVQRQMIAVLGHHRVDHHPVADQTLLDDPRRHRRRRHAALFALLAGPLLALGHQHEVLGRLHIQLLALVVADHRRFRAAAAAGALFRRAGNRSRSTRGRSAGNSWRPGCLRLASFAEAGNGSRSLSAWTFDIAHAGLQLQQLQLRDR